MNRCLVILLVLFFLNFKGFSQTKSDALVYVKPNAITLDINSIKLKVDSIMHLGISNEAFPGAQLLVAYKGGVIFHETYGFHTYDSIQKVNRNDVYDLASVTKITGPLPALMKLYEEGKLDLDVPFSNYWKPWKRKKDKKNITLRELLAHQSGLEPYIVFLADVMKKGNFKKRFVRTHSSNRFSRQAYSNLFVNKRFKKRVFRRISKSKVSNNKIYKYSGLASLIYPTLIEDITGENYDDYLNKNFYNPLGCETLGYNPVLKKIKNNIVPTEVDTFFRKDLTKAWVHDENAALLGGVSGNAGLFGTALDLAKYMQMLVQKGNYNGKQYFKSSTVNEFIKVQYLENENRRGLGFDKPLIGNDTLSLKEAYPAPEVSKKSFGHAGFTGTFVWADPEHDLVFVFLSNRVYPSRSHRNIYNLNIRPALQQVFYRAIKNKKQLVNN
jgi:CubicO group peptidase (beta-lactamase class C family)